MGFYLRKAFKIGPLRLPDAFQIAARLGAGAAVFLGNGDPGRFFAGAVGWP